MYPRYPQHHPATDPRRNRRWDDPVNPQQPFRRPDIGSAATPSANQPRELYQHAEDAPVQRTMEAVPSHPLARQDADALLPDYRSDRSSNAIAASTRVLLDGRNRHLREPRSTDWPGIIKQPHRPYPRLYPDKHYPGGRPPLAWDRPVLQPAELPSESYIIRHPNSNQRSEDSISDLSDSADGMGPISPRKPAVRARPGSHAERSRQRRDALRAENARRKQEMNESVDAFNRDIAARAYDKEIRDRDKAQRPRGPAMPMIYVHPDGREEPTNTHDPRFNQPPPPPPPSTGPTDEEIDEYWRNRGPTLEFRDTDRYYFRTRQRGGEIRDFFHRHTPGDRPEPVPLPYRKGSPPPEIQLLNHQPQDQPPQQTSQDTPLHDRHAHGNHASDQHQYPLMQNAYDLAEQEKDSQTLEDIQFSNANPSESSSPLLEHDNNEQQTNSANHSSPLAPENPLLQSSFEQERDKPLDERIQQEEIASADPEPSMGKDTALLEAETEEKYKPILDGTPPPSPESLNSDQAAANNQAAEDDVLNTAATRDKHSGHFTLKDDTQINRVLDQAGDTPVFRRHQGLEAAEKEGIIILPVNPMSGRGGIFPQSPPTDRAAAIRTKLTQDRDEAKSRTDAAVDKITQIVTTKSQWQAEINEKVRSGKLTPEQAEAEVSQINSEVTTALQQASDDYQNSLISAQDLDRIYKTIGHTSSLQDIQKNAEAEQLDNKALELLVSHVLENDVRATSEYRENELRHRRYPQVLNRHLANSKPGGHRFLNRPKKPKHPSETDEAKSNIALSEQAMDEILAANGIPPEARERLKREAIVQASKKNPITAGELATKPEFWIEKIPVVGGLGTAARLTPIVQSVYKLENGDKLSESEQAELEYFLTELEREPTMGATLLDMGLDAASIATEFAATGGLATAARVVTKEAASVAVGSILKKFATEEGRKLVRKSLFTRAAGVAVDATLARTPAQLSDIVANALHDQASRGVGMQVGENGETQITVNEELRPKSLGESLGKSFVSQAIDNASGPLGSYIHKSGAAQALKNMAKPALEKVMQNSVLQAFVQKNPGKTALIEKAFGLSGAATLPEEITSEALAEVLKSTLPGEEFNIPSMDEIGAMVLINAGTHAAGHVRGKEREATPDATTATAQTPDSNALPIAPSNADAGEHPQQHDNSSQPEPGANSERGARPNYLQSIAAIGLLPSGGTNEQALKPDGKAPTTPPTGKPITDNNGQGSPHDANGIPKNEPPPTAEVPDQLPDNGAQSVPHPSQGQHPSNLKSEFPPQSTYDVDSAESTVKENEYYSRDNNRVNDPLRQPPLIHEDYSHPDAIKRHYDTGNNLVKSTGVSAKALGAIERDLSPTDSARGAASADSDGNIYFRLRPDLVESMWNEALGNTTEAKARLEALLDEELTHVATLRVWRDDWQNRGRYGSFLDFIDQQSKFIVKDIHSTVSSLPGDRKTQAQEAIWSSWKAYFDQPGQRPDITPENILNHLENPNGLRDIGAKPAEFIMETVRQLRQISSNHGPTEAAGFQRLIDRLTELGLRIVEMLRKGSESLKEGDLGQRLKDLADRTETYLKDKSSNPNLRWQSY